LSGFLDQRELPGQILVKIELLMRTSFWAAKFDIGDEPQDGRAPHFFVITGSGAFGRRVKAAAIRFRGGVAA
jgi:hypothetical protein